MINNKSTRTKLFTSYFLPIDFLDLPIKAQIQKTTPTITISAF